jgi:rhodanese-related sulfurtransferase
VTVREIQVNDVRSGDGSARLLAAAGARVRSLTGGTEAWRQAGHPVETGR